MRCFLNVVLRGLSILYENKSIGDDARTFIEGRTLLVTSHSYLFIIPVKAHTTFTRYLPQHIRHNKERETTPSPLYNSLKETVVTRNKFVYIEIKTDIARAVCARHSKDSSSATDQQSP